MHKPSLLAGWLLIAWSCTPVAWAWGPQGHRTVGAIADRLLSPAGRAAVGQLLQGDLDKFGSPSGRTTLESVSVWADEVRGTPADQPRWHYDNVPVCGTEPKARYCPGGQCNSEQIKRLTALLADPRAAPRTRNEALKWLVHLVGDLHQPLHAADNADLGGTRVAVALQGRRTRGRENLHRAWDAELVRLALRTGARQPPPRELEALAAEARQLLRDGGQGSPDDWARQSNSLARNVAYQYPGFVCNAVPARIVVLDRAYQSEAAAIVRERLLLAGARLAALLEQALATSEPRRRQ